MAAAANLETDLATIALAGLSFLVSLVSMFIANGAKRLSEQESAKSVYRRYLELAFANPKFMQDEVDFEEFHGDDRVQYRLFVAIMLHACEEILERDNDPEWHVTIKRQLGRHKAYLAVMSPELRGQYEESLRALVRTLVNGGW